MASVEGGITLEHLQTGAVEDGDFGNPMDQKPNWLDMEKFQRGQKFFQKHAASIIMSMHFSLVAGFSINNLLVPLVFTNKSDTPKKSLHRYVQTTYHILLWLMDADIWEGQYSKAFRSISVVKKMHRKVAEAMNKKSDETFVSQYDMGVVQCGFMGAIVMYPEYFGVRCSKEDLQDYIYTWRGIGYLLGVDDMYNICQGNYKQTYNIAKEIEHKLLIPALKDPPEEFDNMSQAYMDGINSISRFKMTTRASMLALFFDGAGEPVPSLSLCDNLRFYGFKFCMLMICWVPGVRQFMNRKIENGMRFLGKQNDFQF